MCRDKKDTTSANLLEEILAERNCTSITSRRSSS